MARNIKVFSNTESTSLAEAICGNLAIPLSTVTIKEFSDGEIFVRLEADIRGQDVFLICSTNTPFNNFVEALFLADAARNASASRVTLVIPYFGCSRQEVKGDGRTAVAAVVMARALREDVNRVLLLDLHAEQTINEFRPAIIDHLYGSFFIIPVLKQVLGDESFVVAAPDAGGGRRARKYNELLGTHRKLVYFDKSRPEPNKVGEVEIVGSVRNRTVVLVDDIVDTGGTLAADAQAAKKAGAHRIIAATTHGVLSGNAIATIDDSPIDTLIVSDTIASVLEKKDLFKNTNIIIASCAKLLAEAIRRIHDEESVSKLIL